MVGPYELSEDEKMIIALVKDIAKNKVAPREVDIDRTGTFPWDIVDVYRECQILSLPIPTEYGGGGCHELVCCMVLEEIAKYCANSAHILADHWLGITPLLVAGTAEQKKWYLPEFVNRLAAFALTEPEAGSDVGGIRTKAVKKGNQFILNGQKCFCTDGAEADFLTVFARSNDAPGSKGLSAFIVEKEKVSGLSIGKIEDQMGMRGTRACEVILEDCAVDEKNLLGGIEGVGFKTAMQTFDRTRPTDAALALGIAESALSYAIDYSKQRKQFGQLISEFQGLQFMMADMATNIEAAKGLCYQAAWLIDRDKVNSKLSAMANYFSTDIAVEVCTNSMQILGGYGYMRDYPLEQKLRDARLFQIVEGANQVLRVVVARSLLSGM